MHVDHPARQQERYFLMEGAGQDLLTGVQAIHQQEGILEACWWTRAELEATTEPVFPEELATQLGRISALVSPSRADKGLVEISSTRDFIRLGVTR